MSILSALWTIVDFRVVLFQSAEFDFFLLADLDFDLDFDVAPFPLVALAVADPFTGASFDVLILAADGFLFGLFGL